MSSYRVIAEVSRTLQELLWEAFREDSDFNIVTSQQEIVFKNPTETARDSANRLSLWLYHITENEFAKNRPMVRRATPDTLSADLQFPPLALDFYYLVTPFGPTGEMDQMLLGKTMQVLYDNAVIYVRNEANEVTEEVRVVFSRLSLEELTRIWESLREPYRLSVCYQIRVTHIESTRQPGGGRVLERTLGYADRANTDKRG